jgi:hypothetical protein
LRVFRFRCGWRTDHQRQGSRHCLTQLASPWQFLTHCWSYPHSRVPFATGIGVKFLGAVIWAPNEANSAVAKIV